MSPQNLVTEEEGYTSRPRLEICSESAGAPLIMKDILTVAVCTRDRPHLLRRCLSSLQPQMDLRSELLVVDSAPCVPGVASIATAAGARYVSTTRPGLDVARNLALRSAKGAIVAFIDDDAVPCSSWVQSVRDAFADYSVDCLTGRVLPLELRTAAQRHFEERFSFDRGDNPMRFTVDDERRWFPVYPWHLGTGCNMAFRRQIFDVIGPFDEALDVGTPTGGGGDIDIFRRLLLAGFVAAYEPAALVYHEHRVSQADSRRQFWAYGKSFTALMTKTLLVERRLEREAWRLAIHRFGQQGRRIGRWFLGRRTFPLELILAETLGNAVGPLAYLYSRRCVRRERMVHLRPAKPGFQVRSPE